MPVDVVWAASEITTAKPSNIHDILMKIDAVLSDANEQAQRIRNFLMRQPMVKEPDKDEEVTDMFSHVTDIDKKALALNAEIDDIIAILGM